MYTTADIAEGGSMKKWLALYLAGALISWFLIAGMLFSDYQAVWDPSQAAKYRRQDAGASIVIGAFASVAWPAGLPAMYCMTGFAEHGIWRVK